MAVMFLTFTSLIKWLRWNLPTKFQSLDISQPNFCHLIFLILAGTSAWNCSENSTFSGSCPPWQICMKHRPMMILICYHSLAIGMSPEKSYQFKLYLVALSSLWIVVPDVSIYEIILLHFFFKIFFGGIYHACNGPLSGDLYLPSHCMNWRLNEKMDWVIRVRIFWMVCSILHSFWYCSIFLNEQVERIFMNLMNQNQFIMLIPCLRWEIPVGG